MVTGLNVQVIEFPGRKAPYAPVSALREFLERIRETATPARVDRRFLQKLNIASNNEWALLSALKFLGIVDYHGVPTAHFRLLQTSDRYQDTLRQLVQSAYKDLFDAGAESMSAEDLTNYFRVTSSPSQARNAARFFHEACRLAGLLPDRQFPEPGSQPVERSMNPRPEAGPPPIAPPPGGTADLVLRAKAELLEKLPAPRPEWTAAEYRAICEMFLEMLRSLDTPRA